MRAIAHFDLDTFFDIDAVTSYHFVGRTRVLSKISANALMVIFMFDLRLPPSGIKCDE